MQRIKHHYCWVKAVKARPQAFSTGKPIGLMPAATGSMHIGWQTDKSAPTGAVFPAPMASQGFVAAPFVVTGTVGALASDALPALTPQEVHGMVSAAAKTTGSFTALVGKPHAGLSPADLAQAEAPLTATGMFEVLSDAQLQPLTASGVVPPTDTGPLTSLMPQSMPAVTPGDLRLQTDTGPLTSMASQSVAAVTPGDLGLQTDTGPLTALASHPIATLAPGDLGQVNLRTDTVSIRALTDTAFASSSKLSLPHLRTDTGPIMTLTGQMFVPASMQTSGRVQPDTDTGPISTLLGQSLPGLMFAGATFMGAWQVEADPGKDAGIELHFMPIVGSRQEALTWRDSTQGQAWAADALAISLLSFAAIGEL